MLASEPTALSPDDPSFDISDEADVKALFRAEQLHFWHRSRNRFILGKVGALGVARGAHVLELGCGAGCVASELARAGYRVTGVDGHRALLDVAARRAPEATFLCRDLRGGVPDLDAEAFDVVCLFDVIEHLDDPVPALARALGWLRPGGYVVGTVPALMSLWSAIDEHAGHKTRYSVTTLRPLLERAGSVVEIAPFFRSLVPLIWAQRKLVGRRAGPASSVKNLSVPPWPVNAALLAMVTLEHRIARRVGGAVPGASIWFTLTP